MRGVYVFQDGRVGSKVSCPFCGSGRTKTEYRSKKIGTNGLDMTVYHVSYHVRCTKCHARGPVFSGKCFSLADYPVIIPMEYALPDWATTWEVLKDKAEQAWQERSKK